MRAALLLLLVVLAPVAAPSPPPKLSRWDRLRRAFGFGRKKSPPGPKYQSAASTDSDSYYDAVLSPVRAGSPLTRAIGHEVIQLEPPRTRGQSHRSRRTDSPLRERSISPRGGASPSNTDRVRARSNSLVRLHFSPRSGRSLPREGRSTKSPKKRRTLSNGHRPRSRSSSRSSSSSLSSASTAPAGQGWGEWFRAKAAEWHPREWRFYKRETVASTEPTSLEREIRSAPQPGFFARTWYSLTNFFRNFGLGTVARFHSLIHWLRNSSMRRLNSDIRSGKVENPKEISVAFKQYKTGAEGQNKLVRDYLQNTAERLKIFEELDKQNPL